MKKWRKWLSLGALLVIAVLSGIIASSVTAQAKTRTKHLTTVPKVLRGTWYHYYGSKMGGMRKTVITKHHYRSYYDGQKSTLKHVGVLRTSTTGKWRYYTVIDRRNPNSNYQESSFALHRMKLHGKKRWVLVQPQQIRSLKPVVLTHFNPGKHQIGLPTSAYRFL